ncbi:MAG: sugar-binding protein [Armatimonadota bacterium]
MKNLRYLLAVLALAGCLAALADGRWTPPTLPDVNNVVPRLTQPLTVDGRLTEWGSAACVPIRAQSNIIYRGGNHQWLGPADAGMEAFCAWTADGLALAVNVTDNEIINTKQPAMYYEQDCVELFVDARADDKFGKAPYSKGAYQLFVRPPLKGQAPDLVLANGSKLEGARVAGVATAKGYMVEVFLPLAVFPGFTPKAGASVGFEFMLDDYDARDGDQAQPCAMNVQAVRDLWQAPQKFMKWSLIDGGAETSAELGAQAHVGARKVMGGNEKLTVGIDLGTGLSARAGSARIRLIAPDGATVAKSTVKLSNAPAPWQAAKRGAFTWPTGKLQEGYYTLSVTIDGKDGRALCSYNQPILSVGSMLEDMYARLGKANVAALSQTNPLQAAGYLAAGACVERLKRGIETSNLDAITWAQSEFNTRMAVLEGGTPAMNSLLDLLALGANPEAQVRVEFNNPAMAIVYFYSGSIPFAEAMIRDLGSVEEAQKAVDPAGFPSGGEVPSPEQLTIAGKPALLRNTGFIFQTSDVSRYNPAGLVLRFDKTYGTAYLVDPGLLNAHKADAVVYRPDCPPNIRGVVERWAAARKVPEKSLQDALKNQSIVIAGSVPSAEEGMPKIADVYWPKPASGFNSLAVADGTRLITLMTPSRTVAVRMAELILAGKPISPQDADTLRVELVKTCRQQLGPMGPKGPVILAGPGMQTARLPEGLQAYCGDLHMHTFYSDGSVSPIALTLECMAAGLDYMAITDHMTLDGAKLAQGLLKRYGFAYPLTVGQEINKGWTHFNAYPLKTALPFTTEYETIKAAHAQGAVVQWNHPDRSEEWNKAQYFKALGGTALDAWEHIPGHYEEWKAQGMLPVITGTSDTHGPIPWSERTLILAPSAQGEDIAEAIRARQAIAVSLYEQRPEIFFGSDDMRSVAWSLLADGEGLKQTHAARLKAILKNADLVGLLKASPPRVVTPDAK